MILINVKFKVRPEYVETFRDEAAEFTNATRAEPGCLFYEWYRSTDRPDEYVLVEGFQDDAAEAHVNSEHFKKATELFPTLLVETPTIINTLIPGKTEWDEMARQLRGVIGGAEGQPPPRPMSYLGSTLTLWETVT